MSRPISSIKTPGVYVDEIPAFPPSVAAVATAIPVFIGYTEKAERDGKDVTNVPVRISSVAQFASYFGGPYKESEATVVLDDNNNVDSVSITPGYQLFNAVQMFYINGGSNCYIISVARYKTAAAPADFVTCFEALKKQDEPTLIVVPDAVMLEINDYATVMKNVLRQCGDLMDRFAILDVYDGTKERDFSNDDVIKVFRESLGTSNLTYGAAYYPWLRTTLPCDFKYEKIALKLADGSDADMEDIIENNPTLRHLNSAVSDRQDIYDAIDSPETPFDTGGTYQEVFTAIAEDGTKDELIEKAKVINQMLLRFIGLNILDSALGSEVPNGSTLQEKHVQLVKEGSGGIKSTMEKLIDELLVLDKSYPDVDGSGAELGVATRSRFITLNSGYNISDTAVTTTYGDPTPDDIDVAVANVRSRFDTLFNSLLGMLTGLRGESDSRVYNLELKLISENKIYAGITKAIKKAGIIVPPSGAMAGIYASVDGTRGVWKAPANVSLNAVIEPVITIDNNIQDDLNIDVDAGKSVNAIRAFTGKGVLVWGARTLAGNDNDWRYISVRRLYIMVEESVQKACSGFVFEPNDANTWSRVRAMIENFLTVLWRDGALMGAKPDQSFYVRVGLGSTMTPQDVLEGRMIVEIGMSPVRPAEFIILRFTQFILPA